MKMSKEERRELLELYKDLRVADVRDGMDWNMMHHYGSMSYDIRPLWRTRTCGIARTARYLPWEGTIPTMTPEEYTEWVKWWYKEVCTHPWMDDAEPGDFAVVDQNGIDAGLLGSNNCLWGFSNGIRGFVTNGGVRDTDEVIIERIPVWSKLISQKMTQGRIRYDGCDTPVNVGGVLVNPGDVVVADGDGVIVVPRKLAREVAKYAHQELANDKAGRRKLYEKVGLPFDDTVK